jgi:hypothetical protein
VKRLAIFLSFLIAGLGVSAAMATAAPSVPNSVIATTSKKTRRPAKTRSSSARKSGKASLKTVAARRKRSYRRRRYYHRRYRYRGPLHPSHERVSEIQSALVRSGYYKGEPNGKWDATTISAMRNFQEDHGIDGTGKIDALSLQKLGLGSEIAGVDAPHPPVPQSALPNGQSAPAAVPGATAKPQTPQIPQTPKAPDTGSGTSSPAGNSTATPSTSSDSSSSKTVSLR